MRTNLLFILFFMATSFLFTSKSYSQESSYALVADVMPQPQGGLPEIYKKIKYPESAKKAGISGKVYLMIFINESGAVDDVKVIKGLGMGCDEAAVAGIKSTKFSPALIKGAPVKAKLSLPITFQLS